MILIARNRTGDVFDGDMGKVELNHEKTITLFLINKEVNKVNITVLRSTYPDTSIQTILSELQPDGMLPFELTWAPVVRKTKSKRVGELIVDYEEYV